MALPASERSALLDTACAGQPKLRAEVEELLISHEAGGFMKGVPPTLDLKEQLARLKPEEAGERIGNYKLLEQIGEGGFGIVWVAEQEKPVRRRVALKIIKLGMDTKEVIARFEQERQALAMMDHPNIAKVFDAGATPFGRPFFVMELVRGIKITDYCDQANLSTDDRLQLFITVCRAVQHAHQKGIIHRDLKPSNILVTLHDGVTVPKVIDFGVAKATQSQRLTHLTIYTQFEQMIGTPLYMSPEQAEMSGLDIDTRSDIYSLGVLLYELLVGRTPFDPKVLMKAGLDEIRRVIREEEPPRPSTALQTMTADAGASVAQHRQSDGGKLARLLSGELDWIVMKALEKDRTRRYETANGFAEDIRRYLANEPVTAAAPSAAYLFRKFARRHKAPLGLAALIAVVLVAATGISLWQMKLAVMAKEETAEALGEVRKGKAEIDRKKAEVDRKNTEQHAMLAEAARSDRAVAEERLRAGRKREAFAHLARACEYDPRSSLAAEKAAVALNTWQYSFPATILAGHESGVRSARFSPDGARIVTVPQAGNPRWDVRVGGARVWDAATGKLLATLEGHEFVAMSAEFSPDGTRIVTAFWDGTARVWDTETGQSLALLTGHHDKVFEAQFSPDGARIVTASFDKTARVWEAATGNPLATLAGHEGRVRSARFSSDGMRILTISEKTARVWGRDDGQKPRYTREHEGRVSSSEFSPDGVRIITLSGDKTATVWDTATGQSLALLTGHESTLLSARFSRDGARIVTASLDRTARVWEAATGKPLATLAGHEGGVWSAKLNSDGTRVVTASDDRTARVWEAATGKLLATLAGHESTVLSAQFSSDSTRIATTSQNGIARVWDTATDQSFVATLAGHEGAVFDAQFSPDSARIVTGSLDNTVQVWEAATGKPLATLAGHEDVVRGTQFSPDGMRILTVSDKTPKLWAAATGKPLATLTGHESTVLSAQFSPDGARIVTGSSDKTARVWEAATGKPLATFAGHEDRVGPTQFSPDGSCIVTGSLDKTARVWEAATGKPLATLAGHEGGVWSAEFSPEGMRILTISEKTARVWEAASGKPLATLAGDGVRVWSGQFSPDGMRILTVFQKTVRVWEAASGKPLATLAEHELVMKSGQFSPESMRILTVSEKIARVWEAATGKPLATLAEHENGIRRAQFNSDGTRVVTASGDKTRLLDAATGKLIATLPWHEEWMIYAQFSPDGTRILTQSQKKAARLWTILPAAAGPPPAWFADFLRYLAQMRLNSDGELETLKPDDWLALQERMRALRRASAGQDTPYLRILRRFVPE